MALKLFNRVLICIVTSATSFGVFAENLPILSNQSKIVPAPNVFKIMQTLRSTGELDQSIQLGEKFLKNNPRDADVMLLMGLIFYQKKDFSQANMYLNKVLNVSPHYLDAKLGLIRIALAQKNFKKADLLLASAKKQAPDDSRVDDIQVLINKIKTQKSNVNLKPFLLHLDSVVINPRSIASQPSPLKRMQTLRMSGQVEQAITLGEAYLKKHPDDADILLVVGLSYFQQRNVDKALNYLNHALIVAPNYLDVKLGLIRIAIEQKKYNLAAKLIANLRKESPENVQVKKIKADFKSILYQNELATIDSYISEKKWLLAKKRVLQLIKQNPQDVNARLKLANIYLLLNDFTQSRQTFEYLLRENDHNKQAYIGLIHVELAAGNDRKAMFIADRALLYFPSDPDFLVEQAKIYVMQHKYGKAADLSKQIMRSYPKNTAASGQLKAVGRINPHFLYGVDEIGSNTEVDSISDLKNDWEYTNVYYNRDASWGSFSLNMNNASRFGTNANQGLLSISPVINKNLYFRLTGAYANEPVLFPTYLSGVEGYFSGMPVELSAGYTYAYILPQVFYSQYTASISKEWGDYWISFRPNFYRPHRGDNSILYTGTLIRYLGFKDTSARVTVGSGTSPDLANLTTADFIVIKNNFITFNVQFPVISHRFLLTLGGNYQHWVFPSNRVRRISGANLGFNYRFEGIA